MFRPKCMSSYSSYLNGFPDGNVQDVFRCLAEFSDSPSILIKSSISFVKFQTSSSDTEKVLDH